MAEKMKAVRLHADWRPRPGFKLGSKDIDKRQTYLGSRVWHNPSLAIEEVPVPKPGPGQVLIEVKACGICGSDVHMAQSDDQGYILYPGLTGFPCTLGHELAGVVVEAGAGAAGGGSAAGDSDAAGLGLASSTPASPDPLDALSSFLGGGVPPPQPSGSENARTRKQAATRIGNASLLAAPG